MQRLGALSLGRSSFSSLELSTTSDDRRQGQCAPKAYKQRAARLVLQELVRDNQVLHGGEGLKAAGIA
eukprot:scaffold61452_cov31-Prasinocladus_malaysianus.AAC.1